MDNYYTLDNVNFIFLKVSLQLLFNIMLGYLGTITTNFLKLSMYILSRNLLILEHQYCLSI
jgi:hypothetical protein